MKKEEQEEQEEDESLPRVKTLADALVNEHWLASISGAPSLLSFHFLLLFFIPDMKFFSL